MTAESEPEVARARAARPTADDAAEAAIARLRATAAAGSRSGRARRGAGADALGTDVAASSRSAVPRRAAPGRGDMVDVVEALGLHPTRAGVVLLVAAALLVSALGVAGGWMLRSTTGPADAAAGTADDPFAPASLPVAPVGTSLGGTGGTVPGDPGSPAGAAPQDVAVHAAGAVAAPGVVEVAGGARVADVVAAAGGATPDADLDRVNLAAPVADGQRIYVPRHGELAVPEPVGPDTAATGNLGSSSTGAAETGTSGAGATARIDLNRATQTELEALPGIGPTLASAIVEHRTRNGPFRTVQGLLDVPGIGDARLAQLQDLVTVGP